MCLYSIPHYRFCDYLLSVEQVIASEVGQFSLSTLHSEQPATSWVHPITRRCSMNLAMPFPLCVSIQLNISFFGIPNYSLIPWAPESREPYGPLHHPGSRHLSRHPAYRNHAHCSVEERITSVRHVLALRYKTQRHVPKTHRTLKHSAPSFCFDRILAIFWSAKASRRDTTIIATPSTLINWKLARTLDTHWTAISLSPKDHLFTVVKRK